MFSPLSPFFVRRKRERRERESSKLLFPHRIASQDYIGTVRVLDSRAMSICSSRQSVSRWTSGEPNPLLRQQQQQPEAGEEVSRRSSVDFANDTNLTWNKESSKEREESPQKLHQVLRILDAVHAILDDDDDCTLFSSKQ